MKCRIGDLAVIINAHHRCNRGLIVRVVAPHDGSHFLAVPGEGPQWWVKSVRPLTYTKGERRYRLPEGPVPDVRLQPIRGVKEPSGRKATRGKSVKPRVRESA
jgi:hypothetical protein